MTPNEMKKLIRTLSIAERSKLEKLLRYGIGKWNMKTKVNGKMFVCPLCGGTALQFFHEVTETWGCEELSYDNRGYDITRWRVLQATDEDLDYFYCSQCGRRFSFDSVESIVESRWSEENEMDDDDENCECLS